MNNIILDDDTAALVEWHSQATGLSESDIINRLLSSHLATLWELRTFLESQPAGTGKHEQGLNLLVSFGPEPIMDGIKRIAPDYVTMEEQFVASIGMPHSTSTKLLL